MGAVAAQYLEHVVGNRNVDRQVFENMALRVCVGQASDCADKVPKSFGRFVRQVCCCCLELFCDVKIGRMTFFGVFLCRVHQGCARPWDIGVNCGFSVSCVVSDMG